MGILDDLLGGALGKSVPQGNISKPLILAVLALLASGALSQRNASGQADAPQPDASPASDNPLGDLLGGLLGGGGGSGNSSSGGLAGGLLGGLGALLEQFQQAGQKNAFDSWIGAGQNQQVSAEQISAALSPAVLGQLSAQTGMSEDDILAQLSEGLPALVDRLTPQGRLPERDDDVSWDELSRLTGQLR